MSRWSPLSLGLLVPLLLVGGCTRTGPGPAHGGAGGADDLPPPPPPDLVALLPEDTFLVARLDVIQIRESPYYSEVVGLLRALSEQVPMGSTDYLDVLARTDEVVAGVGPGPQGSEDPSLHLYLRGRYGQDELESAFRALEAESAQGEGAPTPLVVVERAGHRVFAMEEVAASSLDTHTWLFTVPDRVDEPLARADGRVPGAGPRSSETFRRLAEEGAFDRSAIGVVAVLTPGAQQLLRDDGAMQGEGDRLEDAIIEAVVGATLRASLEQGVDVDGFVETTNPLVAAAIADLIEEMLTEASEEPLAEGLLASRRVTVEGARALLSIRVEDQQVRELISSLSAILALLTALGSADEGVPPEQAPPQPDAAPPPVAPGQ